MLSDCNVPVISARHYRARPSKRVNWVVIHSAETAETPTTAEALARYAHTMQGRVASWHYSVDCDSIVQSVPEAMMAFAAPGANEYGVQIELAGRARQARDEWLDPYSHAMLLRAAELVAGICSRWDVPIVFVDAVGLMLGTRGITTHAEVTKGPGKGRTTHTDPGRGFPMTEFVRMVEDANEVVDWLGGD